MTALDLKFLVGQPAPVEVKCARCRKHAAKWMTGHGWVCGRCRKFYIRRYLLRQARGR